MTSYCQFVAQLDAADDNPNLYYHDHQYGFPIDNDNELFARLVLEINQAGLNWTMILKKAPAFWQAYAQFDIDKVAAFDDEDRARLLQDKGIIRNRLKINAAIHNAQQIQALQAQYGSFAAWLDAHHPLSLAEWTKIFKKIFRFTGGEIVNEFLMSTGYLKGAHDEDCPIYAKILAAKPKWAEA